MSRFCLGCEQFPHLAHPHEWFDAETLLPAAAPVVVMRDAKRTTRRRLGVRDADAA